MKKLYFALALLIGINVSMAQTKSAGPVTLGGLMTLKIDKNLTTSTVTVTLTGPSDKWFGIGFNAFGAMANGTDCLYYSSSLVDSVITGQGSPTTDATNEWTTSSNTISGTTRTLVLTRNFTGGTGDYTFVYNDNALNIIWAYGSGLAMAQHAGTARGSSALGFTLGIDDFSSLTIETKVKEWITSKEISFGKVMQPLRLSLVGAMKGPHIFDIIEMIGKEEALHRIKKIITELS